MTQPPGALRHSVTSGPELQCVAALAAARRFEKEYFNREDRTKKAGRNWHYPFDAIEAWEAKLEAFATPPTAVYRSLLVVFGLWALEAPLPASRPEDQERVLGLLRDMAFAVGAEEPPASLYVVGCAEPPRTLAEVSVPLVGTRTTNAEPRVADCVSLAPERVYEATTEIEAAVAAGKRRKR